MREKSVMIGQRFCKADGTGMIFEVEELVMSQGLPHVRLALVTNPTDKRVIAVDALTDRKIFVRASDGSLPDAGLNGQLHLAVG